MIETPETPDAGGKPLVDWDAIRAEAEDVPPIGTPYEKPDHKASRERPRWAGRARTKTQDATSSKSSASRAKPKKTVPNRKGQFVQPITQLYGYIGMGVFVRDQVCGAAIIQAAPQCAEAWDEMAYKNEAVRRVLWAVVQTGDLGKIIAAHLPILVAAMSHHVPVMRDNPAVDAVIHTMGMGPVESEASEDSDAA